LARAQSIVRRIPFPRSTWRSPAQLPLRLGGIADTAREVLIAGPIMGCGINSFGLRHSVDFGNLDCKCDSFSHRRLGHALDIEVLTDCRVAVGGKQGAGDGVVDLDEARLWSPRS